MTVGAAKYERESQGAAKYEIAFFDSFFLAFFDEFKDGVHI